MFRLGDVVGASWSVSGFAFAVALVWLLSILDVSGSSCLSFFLGGVACSDVGISLSLKLGVLLLSLLSPWVLYST